MSFFRSAQAKRIAEKVLSFGTIYIAAGLLVNAHGPIIGSVYGLFLANHRPHPKDSVARLLAGGEIKTQGTHCDYIEIGNKIAGLWFRPLQAPAVYKDLTQSAAPKQPPSP